MPRSTAAVPAPLLAVAAMVAVQAGIALSAHLFPLFGAAGTAWLRLTVAALVLLVVARPRIRNFSRRTLRDIALLGLSTGFVTLLFTNAVERIPLGTASAIEFLGPLGVAALRSTHRRALLWPAVALVGVIALTRPWTGEIDLLGVGFALAAACCWGLYIVSSQKVGDSAHGTQGLALAFVVSSLATAPFGVVGAVAGIAAQPVALLQIVGIALLVPLIPFVLEMQALRRMTITAFGTFSALEPGIAAVLGLLVLSQLPDGMQIAGLALVVAAGIGAARMRGRTPVAVPVT